MSLGKGAIDSMSVGHLGANLIADTTERSGDWGVIQALTDVTFTKLTTSTIRNADDSALTDPSTDWNGVTLLGGDRLFGRFSSVQLASGIAVCYKI